MAGATEAGLMGQASPDAFNLEIHDLRDVISHRSVVAERIWRAWWEPDGQSLYDVDEALDMVLSEKDFSFTLVAVSNGRFVGTATSIQTDIDARPDLGPCLAALWVEPEARGRGVGGALISAVLGRLSSHGFAEAYLSAKPHMRGFYENNGWTLIESDIDRDHQDVFVRTLKQASA